MSKNPVVHFEMPYKDAKRVAEFYQQAFGWKMNQMGDKMNDYIVAHTAETDADQMVKTPGTINGGFFDVNNAQANKVPSVVISVPDLNKALEDIKKAGGKPLGEPQEIPGVGLWLVFTDSEDNRVSILQASR